MEPVRIHLENTLLTRSIAYPVHDLIEERFSCIVHTAEFEVIAGLDRLKTPEQELLLYSFLLYSLLLHSFSLAFHSLSLRSLYTKTLRITYRQIENLRAY